MIRLQYLFSIPEDRYFYSKSVNENTNLLDLRDINFSVLKDFSSFEAYQFYIKKDSNKK